MPLQHLFFGRPPGETDQCGEQPVDDPDGSLAAKLVAVRVAVERVEVHVRGVTAEPWGHGRTLLERDGDGAWRLSD